MNARRSAQRIAWLIRRPSNAAGAPFGRNPEGQGALGAIPLLPAAGSGPALRGGRRLGLPTKAPPSHTRQQARQAPSGGEPRALPRPMVGKAQALTAVARW